MSKYNYSAMLQYFNITHGNFIVITIILFLVSSFVYFLYKLGLFNKITFKQQTLSQCHLVFISYQGSYDLIQSSFGKVMQDFNTVFKVSDPFGIYYDNPNEIQNPDESRAVIGCVVNKMQEGKIKFFLSKYPQYKSTTISRPTSCIGTTYPFFNALSLILIINRVYPKLAVEVKKRKIEKSIGVLQIYKIVEDKNQHVKILMPYENLEQFELWYPPVIEEKQKNEQEKKQQ